MTDIAAIVELFEQGRQAEIAPRLQSLVADRKATLEDCAFAGYLALHGQGKIELAIQFLVFCVNFSPVPNEALISLARRVHSEHHTFVAANLFMSYVNNGGSDPFAYDATIIFAMGEGRPDLCIAIYEKAKAQINPESLMDSTLFNIATCLAGEHRLPEAVAIYRLIVARSPHLEEPRANLANIANVHSDPGAIQFFADQADEIARSLPAFEIDGAPSVPFVLNWEDVDLSAVEASVNQNGFCFLRNGCDRDQVLALREFVREYEKHYDLFPVNVGSLNAPPIEQVFKFDAKALMTAIFKAPGAIDLGRSSIRRVTPADQESFVPYHQDSTAFAKSVINIWTPLTPAGGEYPSLELVARRVTRAEQTVISKGTYNLIEISQDYVQARYKGLIHEVADAQPGDCVIFLGTTIHRSSNLSGAVKPRYNLEARWRATG